MCGGFENARRRHDDKPDLYETLSLQRSPPPKKAAKRMQALVLPLKRSVGGVQWMGENAQDYAANALSVRPLPWKPSSCKYQQATENQKKHLGALKFLALLRFLM